MVQSTPLAFLGLHQIDARAQLLNMFFVLLEYIH